MTDSKMRDDAIREAARNAAVDEYCKARPQLLRTRHEECLVKAGFDLAWQAVQVVPKLSVWYGSLPETNGKSNWTAILCSGDDITSGITIACSEYPDRVRYEADRMRFLIGELAEEPDILAYDAKKHSGYVAPVSQSVPMECCGCPVEGNEYMGQVQLVCCGNPEPAGVAASVPVVGEVVAWAEPRDINTLLSGVFKGRQTLGVYLSAFQDENYSSPLIVQPTHGISAAELERLRNKAAAFDRLDEMTTHEIAELAMRARSDFDGDLLAAIAAEGEK